MFNMQKPKFTVDLNYAITIPQNILNRVIYHDLIPKFAQKNHFKIYLIKQLLDTREIGPSCRKWLYKITSNAFLSKHIFLNIFKILSYIYTIKIPK
jgi:hypothetical protein